MEDWIIIAKININKIKKFVNTSIDKKNKICLNLKSTVGCKSLQYDLFKQIKNSFVEKIVKSKINKSLKKINISAKLKVNSAWTVIGNKGSYHKLHKHCIALETNKICSVIYLETPKKDKNENGNFYCVFRNKGKIEYFTYSPRPGDMIIFPVWLLHGVYPQDKGVRQSLNIDFLIV